MDRTVRALTDLSAVDDQLSGREALTAGLAFALEERRTALRQAIPGIILAAYDALGRVGRRPVVVPVRGAHCGGCYLRLPPQLDSSIRRRQSLCCCPHCRRLLYSSALAVDEGDPNESKHKLGERPAVKARASKPVRRIPGGRPARPVTHPSKGRAGASLHRERDRTKRRGELGSRDTLPTEAAPVERRNRKSG